MEDYHLLFEGSIDNRSISLFKGDEEVTSKESNGDFKNSSFFAVELDNILSDYELGLQQMSFLGVGSGPGSYTGLRTLYALLYGISVSSDIPIVQADTLDSLVSTIPSDISFDRLYACIDARRQEAYSKVYDTDRLLIRDLHSEVFDQEKMNQILNSNETSAFIGNFHVKLKEYFGVNLKYLDNPIHSRNLNEVARRNFEEKKYLNDSFPSPLYFKNPKITVSRKKLFNT